MADPKPVFGRPVDWDTMTPKQKDEWAHELLIALGLEVKKVDETK
jgi:hypothetical protein